MHTLGFRFKPWIHDKSIADGPSIMEYLHETIEDYELKNDILLIHGESDSVVPIARMEHAVEKLSSMSESLETKVYKNLEHSINEDGLILGCDFIKKRL